MTDMVSTAPDRRGRTVKFTPERLEQIRNLVERGLKREEIAKTIGVTVGSLQVTCSNKGISLRKPRSAMALPKPPPVEPPREGNGNNGALVGPTGSTSLSLVIRRGDRERVVSIPLPEDALNRLALEATFNGLTIAELVARIITEWGRKR